MPDIETFIKKTGPGESINIIHVRGVIDTNTSQHLNKVLSALLSAENYKIVVDLENVNYISSAGWGIFIGEIRTIQSHHGDLKLAALSPEVEEVYQLLEFYNILKAYDSVDQAVTDF